MKALNSFGFPVLRFNFRGTGLSQGEHDQGNGEVDDVRAALDWLDAEYHLPLIFAGFSFGAAVGLRAACADARVRAVIGVGTPVVPVAADTRSSRASTPSTSCRIAPSRSCLSAERATSSVRAPSWKLWSRPFQSQRSWCMIEGADHFFEGRLRELREAIEAWVKEALS